MVGERGGGGGARWGGGGVTERLYLLCDGSGLTGTGVCILHFLRHLQHARHVSAVLAMFMYIIHEKTLSWWGQTNQRSLCAHMIVYTMYNRGHQTIYVASVIASIHVFCIQAWFKVTTHGRPRVY